MSGREKLINLRVFVDPGHAIPQPQGIGGRRGTITGIDPANDWPIVEFDKIGRERKTRVRSLPIFWLLELTPKNEAALVQWEASRPA